MTASYRYDVEVVHLLVSPAHAYFGRAREGAADVPTADADRVELVAGKGIVGDRFFGKAAHMDAAVTLMAIEALETIAAELGVPHKAMRGRGGVRCQALSDGILHRGPAVLISPVPLDPARAGDPTLLRPSRLP